MNAPVYDKSREQCLLMFDGLNIVRRNYEKVNSQSNSPEPETIETALRNSLGSFRRVLTEIDPTHAMAAFDYGGQTWRHREYAAYRANRKPMPQALREALPWIYDQLAERLGMTVVSIPDVEAEDVIATCYSRWAAANRGPAVVVSTDKDLAWLMSQGALILDQFAREWRTAEWSQDKFGVPPELIHDYLALMGDDTDGVPGLVGVGPKTAAKWLLQHGNLEGVLENAASIPGKVGKTLQDNIEIVRLSRKLVSLRTDIQCGVTWNTLRRGAGQNLATPQIAKAA